MPIEYGAVEVHAVVECDGQKCGLSCERCACFARAVSRLRSPAFLTSYRRVSHSTAQPHVITRTDAHSRQLGLYSCIVGNYVRQDG